MIQAFAFLAAAFCLLTGWLIYSRIHFLKRWFIPPALIGGVILFCLGPEVTGVVNHEARDFIRSWPPLLLGYLFAAIVLGFESGSSSQGLLGPVVRQNLFVWFLSFGQLFGAYIIYLLFFRGEISPLIAHVVEIGWAGGPGSAAAMSTVMRRLGQPAIGDLGLFSATLGQLWGAVSGIWIVNHLNRRTDRLSEQPGLSSNDSAAARGGEKISANAAYRSDSIADPEVRKPRLPDAKQILRVLLLFLLPLSAVFLGMGAKLLLAQISAFTPRALFLGDIPLFPLALLCAFPVRSIAARAGLMTRENCEVISTINGQVLDWIILAALAALQPAAFISMLIPFSTMMFFGAVFCFVLMYIFAPRMLPRGVWRELGLINYGMATGTTALGLMLLGLLRSKNKEEARIIYGLAVPFNAPFVGGGIISLTLPEWTARGGEFVIPILLLASMVIMFIVCNQIEKAQARHE